MPDMPFLKNCPFCGCAMILEVDGEDPCYEQGDSGYLTATISGDHETELFTCPFSHTEDNGIVWDLANYKSLEQVADEWNRRLLFEEPIRSSRRAAAAMEKDLDNLLECRKRKQC